MKKGSKAGCSIGGRKQKGDGDGWLVEAQQFMESLDNTKLCVDFLQGYPCRKVK
jgi:hypothetical protein